MPEMPHAGEHHREPGLVRGRDHVLVVAPIRPAELPPWRPPPPPPAGRRGTERTRPTRRPSPWRGFRQGPAALRGVLRLHRRDARGIDARHLPRADADRRPVLGVDDRVGFDVLGDAKREFQIGELLRSSARAWSPPSASCRRRRRCRGPATRKPPATVRSARPGSARIGQAAGQEQPQVLLRRDQRDGLLVGVGRDDDLGEDLDDSSPRLAASSRRFSATMPPKADTGSQRSALR